MWVLGLIKGAAADEAGLRQGDELLAVGGVPTAQLSPFQAAGLLAGAGEGDPPARSVPLTVRADGLTQVSTPEPSGRPACCRARARATPSRAACPSRCARLGCGPGFTLLKSHGMRRPSLPLLPFACAGAEAFVCRWQMAGSGVYHGKGVLLPPRPDAVTLTLRSWPCCLSWRVVRLRVAAAGLSISSISSIAELLHVKKVSSSVLLCDEGFTVPLSLALKRPFALVFSGPGDDLQSLLLPPCNAVAHFHSDCDSPQ